MKEPSDKLVEALAADKLLDKLNYTLSVKKGKLIINGTQQTVDIAAKYKTLLDALSGSDVEMKNSNK